MSYGSTKHLRPWLLVLGGVGVTLCLLTWLGSREWLVWDNAHRQDTVVAYQDYLTRFSSGEHASEAKARIASLPAEEQAALAKLQAAEVDAWREASQAPTVAKLTAYFDLYPAAPQSHHEDAVTLLYKSEPSDAHVLLRPCRSRLALLAKQIAYDAASGSELAPLYRAELRHALQTRALSRQAGHADTQFVDQAIAAVIDSPIIGLRFESRNASAEQAFWLPLFIENEVFEGLKGALGIYQVKLAHKGAVSGPNAAKWPLISLEYSLRQSATYRLEGTGKVVASQCVDASIALLPMGASVPSFKQQVTACPAESMLVRGALPAFTSESSLNDMLTASMKESFRSALGSIGVSR